MIAIAIILNEEIWAKEAIENGVLGKKPYETICTVAKYYFHQNHTKKEVRGLLDSFLLKCNPSASLPKWSNTLDYAVSAASKRKLLIADSITITEPEIERIKSLSGAQLQRLAFTLLCLAKYWMLANPNGDWWVNNDDREIMQLANINTSIKRQCLLYHDLRDQDMIGFSRKVDNTNVRVLFSRKGATALEIRDFRNLGNQYQLYLGDPKFIRCVNCGLVVRSKNMSPDGITMAGRKQKYCDQCAGKRIIYTGNLSCNAS